MFETRLGFTSPRGRSLAPVAVNANGPVGGSAVLGRVLRSSISAHAAQPKELAAAFLHVLSGPSSEWPAAGQTGNFGPYATNTSVNHFAARQGRTSTGQFTPWLIVNDALNRQNRPYARWVDEGIGTGGGRISAARYAANFRAVERTWNGRLGQIQAAAESAARQRRRR